MEPTSRSANGFCQGDRGAVSTSSIPSHGELLKSGVSGKLVLSVSLYSDGRVKEIHVVRSLSPALDKNAIETVRTMKFRRLEANSAEPLQDLRLQLTFRATCDPRF